MGSSRHIPQHRVGREKFRGRLANHLFERIQATRRFETHLRRPHPNPPTSFSRQAGPKLAGGLSPQRSEETQLRRELLMRLTFTKILRAIARTYGLGCFSPRKNSPERRRMARTLSRTN